MDVSHSQQTERLTASITLSAAAAAVNNELTTMEKLQIQHVVNEPIDEQDTVLQLPQDVSIIDDQGVTVVDSGENAHWRRTTFKDHDDDSTDNFQQTIGKWEEFYDKIYAYLRNKQLPTKNAQSIEKAALSFTMDGQGNVFFMKLTKAGKRTSLPVIRSYDDRLRICRSIHLDTGVDGLHHRRDKMIELLGQKYYWKGQRRDACECIASCDVCSAGLGAKKRAKPPKQPRDVRPPAKLMRLIASPSHVTCHVTNSSYRRDFCEHSDAGTLTSHSVFHFPGTSPDRGSPVDNTLRDIIPLEQNLSPIEVALQETVNSTERQTTLEEPSPTNGSCFFDSLYQNLIVSSRDASHDQAVLPAVADAMHKAMLSSADPVGVMASCQSLLKTLLGLDDRYSVFIAPSLPAAYIIAVSAVLYSIDPLTLDSEASLSPMAVIHDASCQHSKTVAPLKTCTSLTGAFNLNLGSSLMPMDKHTLTCVLQSNRVAAVFYEPYAYLNHQKPLPLQSVVSLCEAGGRSVSVIVDISTMPHDLLSTKFTSTIQDFLCHGADALLLPATKEVKGHPNTCVLIGKSSLLEELISNISALQSQVAFPVTCLSPDLVGTAVTYRIFLSDTTIMT